MTTASAARPEQLDRPASVEPDDAIWNVMKPFISRVFDPNEPDWRAGVARREREFRRKRLIRSLLPWRGRSRDQKEVEEVYSRRWAKDMFAPFRIPASATGGGLWQWRDRCFQASVTGGRRTRVSKLMRLIEELRPRSVLEIGYGEGLNLALLAARFPDAHFEGVELTEGGLRAAEWLSEQPQLPDELVAFSPEPLLDTAAHRRVVFRRGSAAALPFADGAFDLVFTSLAVEQMAAIASKALGEIARVTSRHAVLIEPFAELNDTGLRRDYVVANGYFDGRIADLDRYGLTVVRRDDDLPYKIFLRAAVVLAQKKQATGGLR